MKLTRMSAYAIRAAVYLAQLPPGHPFVTGGELARRQGVQGPFLRSLLQRLVPAGLLLSRKGREGGFRLARPAADITLLEIVEAVDGPLRGVVPPLADGRSRQVQRRLEAVCQEVASSVCGQLRQVHLSDLVDGP
jgi:Rrf2 family protein